MDLFAQPDSPPVTASNTKSVKAQSVRFSQQTLKGVRELSADAVVVRKASVTQPEACSRTEFDGKHPWRLHTGSIIG